MADTIRVLRVLEYVGARDVVEQQLARGLGDGTFHFRHGQLVLRAATVGSFPQILNDQPLKGAPS